MDSVKSLAAHRGPLGTKPRVATQQVLSLGLTCDNPRGSSNCQLPRGSLGVPPGDGGHQGNMTTSSQGHGEHVVQDSDGEGRLHSVHHCWDPSELLQGRRGCDHYHCRATTALETSLMDSWVIRYHWVSKIILHELTEGQVQREGTSWKSGL